jgi:DNA processing protein
VVGKQRCNPEEAAHRDEPLDTSGWGERQRRALLQLLLVDGVGPVLARRLVRWFGSPEGAVGADLQALQQVPGITKEVAARIVEESRGAAVDAELRACELQGVRILLPHEAEFPAALREISAPPILLYVKGKLANLDRLAVAIVGSRRCSLYGRRTAERLAAGLATIGFTIVSGLARGIDAAAHHGALRARGRTIAVLAGGISNIYPPEHQQLAEAVARQGALLSESPLTRKPKAGLFPMRNRLISGLALGVLVVEAATRSGALVTAYHGLEQGKEIFAVPGPVYSPTSHGCHRLIREGAHLIESAEEIFDILKLQALRVARGLSSSPPQSHPFEASLNPVERSLLAYCNEPITLDSLIEKLGLPAQVVVRTLTILELRRFVERLPGNRYRRRS